MRAKHLKGWLVAARKKEREEAAVKQEKPMEESTTAVPGRAEGEGMEEIREKMHADTSN